MTPIPPSPDARLAALLLEAESNEIVVTLEHNGEWAYRLAAWLIANGVCPNGAPGTTMIIIPHASDCPAVAPQQGMCSCWPERDARLHGTGAFRALVGDAVANFHDYIGQTVDGADWVMRARAALRA